MDVKELINLVPGEVLNYYLPTLVLALITGVSVYMDKLRKEAYERSLFNLVSTLLDSVILGLLAMYCCQAADLPQPVMLAAVIICAYGGQENLEFFTATFRNRVGRHLKG